MTIKKLGRAILLLAATAIAGTTHAATYYVDYETGSDSNAGTSKTSPWKHAPGMLGLTPSNTSTGDGCTGICSSTPIHPGDSVILKGGVIWPYTSLPWNFNFSGNATSSTYGCTGAGCIYIGYDPTWNKGIVNSVTLTRDLGGCNPSAAPTVVISGGGGSGAAATALVIPSAAATIEPNVAGFVYHINVTNQGNGYTSNPSVAISGAGCVGITAVADIQRPVIDAGSGSGIDWPVGTGPGNLIFGPGLTVLGSYVVVDHLELRNILQAARTSGITTGFINLGNGGAGQNTASNNYIHGRFTDNLNVNQEGADDAINIADGNDEISGNTMENGDSFHLGISGQACTPVNLPCIFSEHDASTRSGSGNDGGEMQHNYLYSIRWMTHWGGNATPLPALIHDNEMWLVLYDAGDAHVNEMYLQYQTGTVYNYNNIFHSAVSGASNQQQLGNGTTQYVFNNISWGLGGGTSNYGMNTDGSAGAANNVFFYNNTMLSDGTTRDCLDDNGTTWASSITVTLQNNHCITTANPYYIKSSGSTYKNQAGSTAQTAIEASSVVDTLSAVASQGYGVADLFSPSTSTNDTVVFASTSSSANLTSLCSGYLVALCSDINGNPRPSSGGWQSGAYSYGSGGSSSVAPPTNLTAVVQ